MPSEMNLNENLPSRLADAFLVVPTDERALLCRLPLDPLPRFISSRLLLEIDSSSGPPSFLSFAGLSFLLPLLLNSESAEFRCYCKILESKAGGA